MLHRISELVAGPLHALSENVAHVYTRWALSRRAANCFLDRSSCPRSHWRESPQGTAHILADVVDQWKSARVPLL